MEDKRKKRILIIEDDVHIAEGMKLNLSLQGYEVAIAPDGPSGLEAWKETAPDLIVLDVMLPRIDGLEVLRSIRSRNERIPILIVSAKGDPADKVKGLSFGVDDYLSKPFNLEEFLLRVDHLITKVTWYRDEAAEDPSRIYAFGGNRIDFATAIAECRSGTITLTDQEVKLLKLFIANRGKPLSRKKLLESGWGYTQGTATRTIDNFIVRFRKYFEENPQKPVYFKSRRAFGYVFDHE